MVCPYCIKGAVDEGRGSKEGRGVLTGKEGIARRQVGPRVLEMQHDLMQHNQVHSLLDININSNVHNAP